MYRPTILCILDGLGLNSNQKGNAFSLANTPVIDNLLKNCPNNTLTTYGEEVGLPEGQMGNSEVGHLNIGAGRVIEQWLLMISKALKGSFLEDSATYQNFLNASKNSKNIHIIGLFSDGGVHSHSEHLKLFIKKLSEKYQGQIVLHLITDGRDTSPTKSLEQIDDLENFLSDYSNVKIASLMGRFFAMDRDNRTERTEKAYQAIINSVGNKFTNAKDAIKTSYDNNIYDEFIEPSIINKISFEENDGMVFWNFRADRMRQIVTCLCLENFEGFKRNHKLPNKNNVLCFTNYEDKFKLPYLFTQIDVKNHLGQVIANNNLSQIRIAETEKYPHVTFFFNGLSDEICKNEDRKLLPSPRDVKTYDLKPEMSAYQVKDEVINAINCEKYDLIVVNFANCDMVGHTGVIEAGIKAVETVDICLGEILSVLKNKNGQALIIADHGNCEQMINYEDNSPHTAHTLHPVPIIVYNRSDISKISSGALCDVAPTVLKLMNIEKPSEMTGTSLT